MSRDDEQLLSVLTRVRESGNALRPRWSAGDPRGFVREDASGEIVSVEESDLEALADKGMLERAFFDRIAGCPKCRSHFLNFREVCPSCSSSNLSQVTLLHHYRCGYVGPTHEFGFARDARRCPKCHGKVRDRGTDHDVPGPLSACQACAATFQAPAVGAVCLSCTFDIVPDKLVDIVYDDIYEYRLAARGSAALRTGFVAEAPAVDSLLEPHLPIHRRDAFFAFVEDAQRRQRRFGSKWALISVAFESDRSESAAAPTNEERVVRALQRQMDETDKIGRYDANRLLLLLDGAGERQARTVEKRLAADAELRAVGARARVGAFEDGRIALNTLATTTHAANRG